MLHVKHFDAIAPRIAARMTAITTVRYKVARSELKFATLNLVKIAVRAAKIFGSNAQKSQDTEKVLKLPRFRAPRANLPDAG